MDYPLDAGIDRKKTNAIFNDNKMKLGLFGINVDSGCAMTLVDERLKLSWEKTKQIAQQADQAGYEVLVPVARWKGIGGENNFNGRNFETYTWAAGLASVTEHITLVTTSHVQTTHPVFAAKQAATIDHISGGRYALNIVCGWFHPELEMFDVPFMEHDERYDYAEEWFEIVRRLWTEDSFKHDGKYFQIEEAFAMPKPIQNDYPPVLNAGGSERGQAFIAKNADLGYIVFTDHFNWEANKAMVQGYRDRARNEHGRELQLWSPAYVVQRDTDEEAQAYLDHYTMEMGDEEAALNAAKHLGLNFEIMPPEHWNAFLQHLKAGYAGFPLVGTAETIAERIKLLSDAGIDGLALNWADYTDGMNRFNAEVMPLLEQAGLRNPFSPS
jgi:alkanesulfonate monooxygenase SsuD/methylene tetrahydromethanopterin reductase-like flavin-dependent oxidoreductase (luciferase family)